MKKIVREYEIHSMLIKEERIEKRSEEDVLEEVRVTFTIGKKEDVSSDHGETVPVG